MISPLVAAGAPQNLPSELIVGSRLHSSTFTLNLVQTDQEGSVVSTVASSEPTPPPSFSNTAHDHWLCSVTAVHEEAVDEPVTSSSPSKSSASGLADRSESVLMVTIQL